MLATEHLNQLVRYARETHGPNGISGSDSTICAHLLQSQAVRGHNDSTARRARNVAELKLARDDQHVFIIHASIFKLRGRHLRIYLVLKEGSNQNPKTI
jgi:hypothetical protein